MNEASIAQLTLLADALKDTLQGSPEAKALSNEILQVLDQNAIIRFHVKHIAGQTAAMAANVATNSDDAAAVKRVENTLQGIRDNIE